MMIGEKTKDEIKREVEALVDMYWAQIKEAWLKAGDSTLSIGLTAALKETTAGKINVKTQIAFVLQRVKDDLDHDVDEDQMDLFKNGDSGKFEAFRTEKDLTVPAMIPKRRGMIKTRKALPAPNLMIENKSN
jgi:hypothetical protein